MIGILRGFTAATIERTAVIAVEEGVLLIEVTMDGPSAPHQIEMLARQGVTIGAGSVLTPGEASRAISVGASFIVTPATVSAVGEVCDAASVPWIPGTATPTEIVAAINLGASAVKVFPATHLGGAAYIRAIRGPLHHPPLIPTGGIGPDNAVEFLNAGALAVGVGSGVFDPTLGNDGRELRRRLRRLVQSIHQHSMDGTRLAST